VTNYGFAPITVSIFLLDYGLAAFTWLPLLDDSSTVTVAIVRLADGYASTDRTDANTNIVRKRGVAIATTTAAANKDFLIFLSSILNVGKCESSSFVPAGDRPYLGRRCRTGSMVNPTRT
jgi:hypothetical protein